MPKKKPLPDYSGAHYGSRREHFTQEKSAQLAEAFDFGREFDLHTKLNDAAAWLDIFRNRGDEPPSVRKRELKELQKRVEALHESLRKLGHHARVAVKANDPKVSQGRLDLPRLQINLQVLAWATNNALKRLPDARKGAPTKDIEVTFATCLREIYTECTGKNDTPLHDRTNDTYSGDFFEFFKACMETVGLVKSDEQLSRLAGEACRKTKA